MHLIWKKYSTALAFMAAAAMAFAATAQAQKQEYTPSVGQEGKDVIWVPTPNELITKMLDMAKLTPSDVHYDLGSGDGRTVIAAAKRGTKAIGVEYNPDMVELSKRNAQKEGVAARAEFIRGDIFETDFSKANVLTLYLLPSLNLKLRPTILNMKPGTRVVSHAFTMGDWQADQTETVEGRTAYLWIVPAKVNGNWRADGGELALKQTFQKIEGTFGGKAIANATLRGDMISFSVDGHDYGGHVSGERIEGTVKAAGKEAKWSATHAK